MPHIQQSSRFLCRFLDVTVSRLWLSGQRQGDDNGRAISRSLFFYADLAVVKCGDSGHQRKPESIVARSPVCTGSWARRGEAFKSPRAGAGGEPPAGALRRGAWPASDPRAYQGTPPHPGAEQHPDRQPTSLFEPEIPIPTPGPGPPHFIAPSGQPARFGGGLRLPTRRRSQIGALTPVP